MLHSVHVLDVHGGEGTECAERGAVFLILLLEEGGGGGIFLQQEEGGGTVGEYGAAQVILQPGDGPVEIGDRGTEGAFPLRRQVLASAEGATFPLQKGEDGEKARFEVPVFGHVGFAAGP